MQNDIDLLGQHSKFISFQVFAGIILCMHPANERWRYSVTPSLIGWAYA